jgi:hypothetical protein
MSRRYDDDENDTPRTQASVTLPTDQFDQFLSRLIGLPNGAHVQPKVVQAMDFYGNTTSYMVQTVKTDEGPTFFITQVNATGSVRYILPPNVVAMMDRQREATVTQVRRRHGKRLAEERKNDGTLPTFTPEMRAKGMETRRKNAAKRAARRSKKGGR